MTRRMIAVLPFVSSALLWLSVAVGAAKPQRIVSLVPAATEMLFGMGAGEHVVGVGNYDSYPPEAMTRPRVGGLLDPNVERVLGLRPDLVVVYGTQTELRQQLERARVPTFVYTHRGLPDITETIRVLGRRVESEASARAMADRIEGELGQIRARLAGRSRPKTLLVIGREPGTLGGIVASGGYGFLHDMLELAGGTDLVADVKRESLPMSTEAILSRAPDVIVELHYGDALKEADLVRERRVWDRLNTVPAVKNGRVYLLAGNEYVIPGPRVAAATQRLARTLHPDAW
jgi:iron complex transport system substrate-binding protein